MAQQTQRYEIAPITEAIIDLRVALREGLPLDVLRQISNDAAKEYSVVEQTIEAAGMLQVQPGISASASAKQKHTGFRFTSREKKYILQRRLDGFTFSRLAPYESWKPFRDEAKQLWSHYRETVEPNEIIRLAVRYINRIDIPQPCELKDYFRTSPEVSEDLPQQLAGFFMQLRIAQDDIGCELLINQTIAPPPRDDVISVILDLDLFRKDNVAQNESQIWDFFEAIHARKNDVFEACITDKTRELFRSCQS
ncbi:MAG: TIGR04255 family protein [Pirellulaceae bacterium]